MTALERRYRRLLRAYPARYRRERGQEILSTLLEGTSQDRRWPTMRDGRALLAGGMRVRCGLNQRLPMAAHLRMAALLGVTLMLLWLAAFDTDDLIRFWRHWHGAWPGAGHEVAYLALTWVVLLAAYLAPRRLVAAASWVTAMLWLWWDGDHGEGLLAAILLIALASLALGKQRVPRLWLCVPGAMLAAHLPQSLVIWGIWGSPNVVAGLPLGIVLWWAVLGCVVLWIGFDPRPAIGVALYVVFVVVDAAGPFSLQPQLSWQMASYAAGATIVAAIAIWQLYRDAAVGRSRKEHDDPEVADQGGPART